MRVIAKNKKDTHSLSAVAMEGFGFLGRRKQTYQWTESVPLSTAALSLELTSARAGLKTHGQLATILAAISSTATTSATSPQLLPFYSHS